MEKEIADYQQEQNQKRANFDSKMNRRKWIQRTFKISLSALGFAGYGYFESSWFEIKKTKIRIPNLPGNKNLKILHLSDLHLSEAVSIDHIDHALAEGFQMQPHACVITGDFITDQPSDEQLLALTQCLAKYAKKAPIFACPGNHDGGDWAGKNGGFTNTEKLQRVFKSSKVRLLVNQRINIYLNGMPISITGLGDLWNKNCLPRKCMVRIPPNNGPSSRFNILLCHNPDAKTIVNDFDWSLMLCGHTHGGQLRIPFSNYAPLAPVSDLSHTEGLGYFQKRPIYITRGVGSLYGLRFNCRPEISLLELSRT